MLAVVLVCFISWTSAAYAKNESLTVSGSSTTKQPCKTCRQEIPIQMALRLNSITDANELFREFAGLHDVEAPFLKGMQFRTVLTSSVGNNLARELMTKTAKDVKKPKPAGCIPELRTVSLRQSDDPWIYYWPSCTRVEQCGGCCSHQLLSCQPVESNTVKFEVVRMEYVGNQMQFKGNEIVEVQNHTKCKCDCVTKAKDCHAGQEYRQSECRCVCRNTEDKALCSAHQSKTWHSDTCSCRCVNVFDCSVGTMFSQATCRCEPVSAQALLGGGQLKSARNITSISRSPSLPNRRRTWQPHDRPRYNTNRPRH